MMIHLLAATRQCNLYSIWNKNSVQLQCITNQCIL